MKLRWKAFERSVWKRVGKYDARRSMSFWQKVGHYLSSVIVLTPNFWFPRSLFTIFLVLIAAFNRDSIAQYPDLWMAGMGLWGLLLVFGLAGFVWDIATLYPEYRSLWILPLSSTRIFQRFRRKLLFGSSWIAVEFLVVYGLLAAQANHPAPAMAGAMAGAALQWLFFIALTFSMIALRLNPAGFQGAAMMLSFVFCFVSLSAKLGPVFAKALCIYNPMGWISAIYVGVFFRGTAAVWWGLAPVLLVFAALPFSSLAIKRLHEKRAFLNHKRVAGFSLFFRDEEAIFDSTERVDAIAQIRSGEFARSASWSELGFIERLLEKLLSPPELRVAEALSAHLHGWGPHYRRMVIYFGLFLVSISFVDMNFDQAIEGALASPTSGKPAMGQALAPLFASIVIFGFWGAKVFLLFGWPGSLEFVKKSNTRSVQSFQSFRLLPVNHWDTAKVIIKANTVLILLLLPLAAILCLSIGPGFTSGQLKIPPTLPFKALLAWWAFSLIVQSTKLTPQFLFTLKHLVSCGKVLVVFYAFLVMGIGLLFSPNLWLDCILGVAFPLSTFGWFVYCGKRYCAGRLV